MPKILLALGLSSVPLQAQHLNEVYAAHQGIETQEYVELSVEPGSDLTGMMLLMVEGDANSAGELDRAVDLTGLTGPPNGLLVIGDTTVPELDVDQGSTKFIENGTQTIYLVQTSDVSAILARVGTNMDPDGDRVTDIVNLATILDLVALADGGFPQSDRTYDGATVLGPAENKIPSGVLCNKDLPGAWASGFLDWHRDINVDLPRTPGKPNVDARSKHVGPPEDLGEAFSGYSVALSDQYEAIGAPGASPGGSVRVHSRVTGQLLLDLRPDDAGLFGSAVDLDGNRLLVGAEGGRDAYLYSLPDGSLLQQWQGVLGTSDGFGIDVALEGSFAAVGTTSDQVLVFDTLGGGLLHTLQATVAGSGFGRALDLQAGRLLIGAPFDATQGSEAGAAYLYDVGTGLVVNAFFAESGGPGDRLGSSVGLEGDRAALGAPGWLGQRGGAIVFDAVSGAESAQLIVEGGLPGDQAGGPRALAFSEGRVLLGVAQSDAIAEDAGAAYLLDALTGDLILEYLPAYGETLDEFGTSVALAGTDALVGAPLDEYATPYGMGSVYLFGVVGSTYCISMPNSTERRSLISATGSTSVLANDLVLAASHVPVGQPGIFYYGPQPDLVVLGGGLRCVGGAPLARLDVVAAGGTGLLVDALALEAPPTLATQITAGSTWYFQAWFRDPGGPVSSFGLSNALELRFRP